VEPEAALLTAEEEENEIPPLFKKVRAPPEYSIYVNT
jgi:hypothetical protein